MSCRSAELMQTLRLVNFLLQNVLSVEKWDTCPHPALILPKESMLMVVAVNSVEHLKKDCLENRNSGGIITVGLGPRE